MNRAKRWFTSMFLLLPAYLSALTALPMKVTVQTGDTLHFPPFMKEWDSSAESVTCVLSTPMHGGTVQFVPNYFETPTNRFYVTIDTNHYVSNAGKIRGAKTPAGYPGLIYIPPLNFTGRDTFTFTVKTSKDSTMPTICEVLVTPPEPGNMTVLLVVNQTLLPDIQTEVNRLRTDLQNEGYRAKIIPFSGTGTTAKMLWDTLVAQYDLPSQITAGAIVIGQLPSYSTGLARESALWCMSKWEGDSDADSIVGYRIGVGGYGGGWYLPATMNIWACRLWGKGAVALGTETDIIKRMLQVNHDYRTGASRLPQTAFAYFHNGGSKKIDTTTYLQVWPSFQRRLDMGTSGDTVHPFYKEFKEGGELWDLGCHGAGPGMGFCKAEFNSRYPWVYYTYDLVNTHFPFRFFLANNCHTGALGSHSNAHLMVKNGGCVLAVSSTDYINGTLAGGQYTLFDTLQNIPIHLRMRGYLARGDRWGRAWMRSNNSKWATVFHGDLSLKPKMAPPNRLPFISRVTAIKTGPLSWTFTVSACDPDTASGDRISAYEWYANGYNKGIAVPDTAGPAKTVFSCTFSGAKRCTVRVEAVDQWKARDYNDIVIKTDSGVVRIDSMPVNWAAKSGLWAAEENPTPSRNTAGTAIQIRPNPFNPGTVILLEQPGSGEVRIEVLSIDGRLVNRLKVSSGTRAVAWDGRNLTGQTVSGGLYLFRVSHEGRMLQTRGLLLK